MKSIKTKLNKIAEILGGAAAVVSRDEVFIHLAHGKFPLTYEDAKTNVNKNYMGYNIYPLELECEAFLCIKSDEYYESGVIEMAILALEDFSQPEESVSSWLKSELDSRGSALNSASPVPVQFESGDIYISVISDLEESFDEVLEVMKNSIECLGFVQSDDEITIVFSDNEPLAQLELLSRNLLEEMFIECTIAYEGPIKSIDAIKPAYLDCQEALKLNKSFALGIKILRPDDILEYSALKSISPSLKKELISKVYTDEFNKILNQELSNTIEVYFSNNLNLTDTANKLFIHRNTLLYRLEKINKATGYDLKNFEDCWKFRLSWVLNKLNL